MGHGTRSSFGEMARSGNSVCHFCVLEVGAKQILQTVGFCGCLSSGLEKTIESAKMFFFSCAGQHGNYKDPQTKHSFPIRERILRCLTKIFTAASRHHPPAPGSIFKTSCSNMGVLEHVWAHNNSSKIPEKTKICFFFNFPWFLTTLYLERTCFRYWLSMGPVYAHLKHVALKDTSWGPCAHVWPILAYFEPFWAKFRPWIDMHAAVCIALSPATRTSAPLHAPST